MKLNKRLLLGGIAVVAIAVIAYVVLHSPAPAPEVGAPAPNFVVFDLNDETVKLSDFRGHPVMLNFWASWCGPCRAEMPYIQAAFEDKAGDGLVVLAVNLQEGKATAQSFMEENGYTFPVGLDLDGSVAQTYQVHGIPMTFLIDSEGIIRFIKIGAFASEAELLSALKIIM